MLLAQPRVVRLEHLNLGLERLNALAEAVELRPTRELAPLLLGTCTRRERRTLARGAGAPMAAGVRTSDGRHGGDDGRLVVGVATPGEAEDGCALTIALPCGRSLRIELRAQDGASYSVFSGSFCRPILSLYFLKNTTSGRATQIRRPNKQLPSPTHAMTPPPPYRCASLLLLLRVLLVVSLAARVAHTLECLSRKPSRALCGRSMRARPTASSSTACCSTSAHASRHAMHGLWRARPADDGRAQCRTRGPPLCLRFRIPSLVRLNDATLLGVCRGAVADVRRLQHHGHCPQDVARRRPHVEPHSLRRAARRHWGQPDDGLRRAPGPRATRNYVRGTSRDPIHNETMCSPGATNWCVTSDDGGATWAAPVEMTAMLGEVAPARSQARATPSSSPTAAL